MKMQTIRKLWNRYKELILYFLFGGLTTLINILVYTAARKGLSMEVVPADILAWFLSVVFAYVTNKCFVFESKSWKLRKVLREVLGFFAARLFSLGVDVVFLYVTVEILHWWEFGMKIAANVVVIILNYVFSKWLIFRKDAAKQQKG